MNDDVNINVTERRWGGVGGWVRGTCHTTVSFAVKFYFVSKMQVGKSRNAVLGLN